MNYRIAYLFILLFISFFLTPIKTKAIEFEYFQSLIFLEVTVDNKDRLLFLLDTGANKSAIDLKIARECNMPFIRVDSVEGASGNFSVNMKLAREVKVGDLIKTNIEMTEQDLSYFITPGEQPLAGILGTDIISDKILQIDFRSGIIEFLDKIDNKSTFISFTFNNGIPLFNLTINDSLVVPLRYDSGASLFDSQHTYINITESVWETLVTSNDKIKPEKYFSGTSASGTVDLPVAQIDKITIGDFQFYPSYVIVQPAIGYFARKDAVGFFGNNLMEKFNKVTLDLIRGLLYFD